MNLSRILMVILILGLLGQLYAYAEQPLKLEAKESNYQFPFFDTPTPVWSYNGRTPGPMIRAKEGSTLVVDFLNKLQEPRAHEHPLARLAH